MVRNGTSETKPRKIEMKALKKASIKGEGKPLRDIKTGNSASSPVSFQSCEEEWL